MNSPDITLLLLSLRDGNREALEELVPLVYQELRRMARRRLGSRSPAETLGTTALVHEAYVKLFDQTRLGWEDRRHFFAVASRVMRQIVVDHARRRNAVKRGGGQRPMDLDAAGISLDGQAEHILALDEALEALGRLDARLAEVVELRFFGGLSVEESAEVLSVHPRTVKRDWRRARAHLYRSLSGTDPA